MENSFEPSGGIRAPISGIILDHFLYPSFQLILPKLLHSSIPFDSNRRALNASSITVWRTCFAHVSLDQPQFCPSVAILHCPSTIILDDDGTVLLLAGSTPEHTASACLLELSTRGNQFEIMGTNYSEGQKKCISWHIHLKIKILNCHQNCLGSLLIYMNQNSNFLIRLLNVMMDGCLPALKFFFHYNMVSNIK